MNRTWLVASALLAMGCGHGKGSGSHSTGEANAVSDPAGESIRSAAYQVSSALDLMEGARQMGLELAKRGFSDKPFVAAMSDAQDLVDGAGQELADYSVEPKTATVDARERWTKNAIDAANDARYDISDAEGELDEFIDKLPTEVGDSLDDMESDLDDAIDALTGAIQTLGGVAEPIDDNSSDSQ